MKHSDKIYEKELYSVWQNQNFESELETIDGSGITILDTGILNEDNAGPDFTNARIRIGNLTFVGDIEIDNDYRDWKLHGHNINNKFNKVILHASLTNKFNQPYVYTKDGRKVPSIKLSDYLDDSFVSKMENKVDRNRANHEDCLKCYEMNDNVDIKIKEKFIAGLGVERFKKKCNKFYNRLKELKYIDDMQLNEPVIKYELSKDFQTKKYTHSDFNNRELWQQLLYEFIFEALGYSKNKSNMLKLAQSANIKFLDKINDEKNFLELAESALFNISGLMPDVEKLPGNQSSDYTKSLYTNWQKLKEIYDGETFDETDWNFLKLRPQNFPTVRIAGGSRFLLQLIYHDLISTMIKKLDEIRNLTVLINSLRSLFVIKSDGFWQKHYVFDKPAKENIKYFIGASRADEIVINVLLPYFAVYFEVFGKEELSKKVFKLYNIYKQRSDNRIVREVAETLQMKEQAKRTVYMQGMIELFRNYCSKGKCLECEIGKIVFN